MTNTSIRILLVSILFLPLNTIAQSKNGVPPKTEPMPLKETKTPETFTTPSFFKLEIKLADGEKINWKDYENKVIVFVNIATKCGFTSQLEDLEKLSAKYKQHGLVVIGLPSNDFGGQAPESNTDIKKFCKLNYSVNFPITEKVNIKTDPVHPLIEYLIQNSESKKGIFWNFEKFVVNPQGKVVDRFRSLTKPLNSDLEKIIESEIKKLK